jgi:hypothetical protein
MRGVKILRPVHWLPEKAHVTARRCPGSCMNEIFINRGFVATLCISLHGHEDLSRCLVSVELNFTG